MSIGIFYSQLRTDETAYHFNGALGRRVWPKSIGALGPGGIWNLLWRAGYQVSEPTSDISALSKCKIAFLHLSSKLTEKESVALDGFVSSGREVIVTGSPHALNSISPLNGLVKKSEEHRPMAPLIASFNNTEEFYAPPSVGVFTIKDDKQIEVCGNLFAAIGERQSPERAVRIQIKDAPLAIKTKGLVVLNGDPFSGYQALLQGHSSVLTWINWRHRMFWLDEHALYLARLIMQIAPGFLSDIPAVKVDLPETTVVYRHDLDNSRDRSFIDNEIKTGTPATHAVLLDRNRKFWTQILKGHPEQESSFHYNTAKEASIIDRLRAKLFNRVVPIRPEPKVICEGGLLRQVRKAREAGIGVETLHRHLTFHYYPESVESLGVVFDSFQGEVLGACSFLRARVIRWGEMAELGEMPDPQFPSWYPFRLYDASINQLLRGWEMTAVNEPEPELFQQMIYRSDKSLFKKVITVIFHPAHAITNTFANQGTISWFAEIQKLAGDRLIPAMTLKEVFRRCGKPWEDSVNNEEI